MAVLTKGVNFADGDQVTSGNLDNLVDAAAFVAGSSGTTDDSSLEINVSGRVQIKDGGVSAGKIAASAVTTAKIAASTSTTDGVTYAKLRYMKDMSVVGNVSGGSTTPSEVDILDEDDMASDSATSLATQQSIKAYVDGGGAGLVPSAYTGNESLTLPNGMIMKMGEISTPSSGTGDTYTVTFAVAFPTGVVCLQVMPRSSGGSKDSIYAAHVLGSPSASAFTFAMESNSSCEYSYWMAIGY